MLLVCWVGWLVGRVGSWLVGASGLVGWDWWVGLVRDCNFKFLALSPSPSHGTLRDDLPAPTPLHPKKGSLTRKNLQLSLKR